MALPADASPSPDPGTETPRSTKAEEPAAAATTSAPAAAAPAASALAASTAAASALAATAPDSAVAPRTAASRSASATQGWCRRLRQLVRGRVQDGWTRVKLALVPNTQAALVSTAAYLICDLIPGHNLPVFGPVACYLAMGYKRSRSPRRVVEMGLGATVGIGIGELFAEQVGFGALALLVVLLIAPLIGRFVDHSELLTYQSAMQSVIVISMAATTVITGPAALGRWVDALIGTFCALAFTIIHPSKPVETPLQRARAALDALARAATTMAEGIRQADDDTLQFVWRRTRSARRQLQEGWESLRWAHQISFVKWRQRTDREVLDEVERVYVLTERVAASLELAVRYGRGEIAAAGPSAEVAELFDRLAGVLTNLALSVSSFNKPVYARRRARELARELDPETRTDSWRSTVVLSLLRSTVMDVLQISGLSRAQAWATLPGGERVSGGLTAPEDDPSAVWGGRD